MRVRRIQNLLTLLILAILVVFVAPAQALTLFDNFGPGDTYEQGTGWTLGESEYDQGDAFAFNLGQSYNLDTIELAVGFVSGANELDVWLMSDVGNQPGNVIEAFHFSDAMGTFGDYNPPLVANSVLRPLLDANTQYWVIASVDQGTWAAWNWNSIGDTGPHASRKGSEPWGVNNRSRGAMRITGSAIPEPATLLLLGAGLVGMVGLRRRLKK